MDSAQDPTSNATPAPVEPPPAEQAPAATTPPRRSRGRLKRILIGGVVSFAAVTLLYGPNNAAMMVAFAVVCTAGIGLIPILFLSWVVGWLVLEIWAAISARRGAATTT